MNITKIKILFIPIIILAIILINLLIFKLILLSDDTTKEPIKENIATISQLNMDTDYIEVIYQTTKVNTDWSNLPLSKKFRKKYNSKNGILNDKTITYIGGGGKSNKKSQIVVLNIDHGMKSEDYYIHYTLNNKNELDDVEIIDKKLLNDEDGNEIVYKSTIENDYLGSIELLAAPGRLEYDPFDYVYVTDNYFRKYSKGFIDYHISCGITPLYKISDKEKHIVFLDVIQDKFDEEGNIIGDEWEKYFKIYYFTDENGWLDDVEVEEISKEEIDKLLNEKNSY